MNKHTDRPRRIFLITLLCIGTILLSSCHSSKTPAAKRYALKGKVISVSKQAGNASIYNDPIPGFMDPMAMPYTIKPPAALDELQPGDTVTADVVVEPDKYWLENVQVTAHAQTPADKPAPQPEKDKKK